MIKNIFYPTPQNAFVWFSAISLLFLLYLGKANPMTILFAYFLETIIIGIFNAFKMFKSTVYRKSNNFGIIFFFLFHYGFFVGIQSIFGFALFSINSNAIFKEPFNIFENYTSLLHIEGIKYAIAIMFLTHFGKFFSDFISKEKYKKFTAKDLMFKPYLRVFVQQFVVIISFFFIVFSEAGIIASILLIVFRLIIDLFMEAIKENSKIITYLSEKLANEKASKEEIKKQLLTFTE